MPLNICLRARLTTKEILSRQYFMAIKKYYEESIFCEEPDSLQTKFRAENILCEEADSFQKKILAENILCQEKNILRKIFYV